MPRFKNCSALLASATLIAAIAVLAALAFASVGAAKPAADPRFAYAESFAGSEIFYGYCVGFACQPTEQYAAAGRASADDAAIVAYLERRFETAPRAGQVYIALVIRAHDRARGEALRRRLEHAGGEVRVFSGCVLTPERLDRLVISYLRQPGFRFER